MSGKAYYINLRNKYLPKNLNIVFILESPPVSGKYFYNPEGSVNEPLFRGMMKYLLEVEPKTKEEGLAKFQQAGYFLVDATYTLVNALSNNERDEQILQDYPGLVEDLKNIIDARKTKVVIIKANVCRLLENRLLADGFNVINNSEMIPFPAQGWQNEFCEKIKKLAK